jgi:hypothetical protein
MTGVSSEKTPRNLFSGWWLPRICGQHDATGGVAEWAADFLSASGGAAGGECDSVGDWGGEATGEIGDN